MFHTKKDIIVVSNRLPFYLKESSKGKFAWHKAAGGLITALEPFLMRVHGVWLGWNGNSENNISIREMPLLDSGSLFSNKNEPKVRNEGYRVGCIPINAQEIVEYYDCISNCTLWSLFHYFFEKCSIDYQAWETYLKINQRFAAYIDQVAAEDDLIWIHDYHLFLTPYFLRRLRPRQQIHFFLHIPFPHVDIFSILPWQQFIIESLLCCQSVGFHHKQYLKNFEDAVMRYRAEKREERRTSLEEATPSYLYANPISIDFSLIDQTSKKECVVKRREAIKEVANGKKMFIGVDRIDYSKGIKERLLALEGLIKKYPELKERFYYYQLVVPSREAAEPYRILKREIDETVGRINGAFSTDTWTPVNYHYGTVAFEELVALYSAADIALVTPLRDGMNLVSKEYIAAHSNNDGILILSQFAGAAAELKESLIVNPYAIKELAETIYFALHMPEAERKKRMISMRRKVKKHDIGSWLDKCFQNFHVSEAVFLNEEKYKHRV